MQSTPVVETTKEVKVENKVVNAVPVKETKNSVTTPEQVEDDGTLSEYKLLLGLNPTDPKVNYNLGLLYVGRGEYDTAEKYLSEAVRLDPENSTASYYLKRVKQKLAANNK